MERTKGPLSWACDGKLGVQVTDGERAVADLQSNNPLLSSDTQVLQDYG